MTTSPDTAASPAGEPGPRADRDRLARGFYINSWKTYERDKSREWDAGRVDPQSMATAYEAADQALAAQAAIAEGPGAERLQAMRDHGVTACPAWCPQPDDEAQHEAHVGPGSSFTADSGDTVTIRPRASWWAAGDPNVEIAITPAGDGDGTVILNATELGRLQQLSDQVLGEAGHQRTDSLTEPKKPAYPGAAFDAADAAWNVSSPATAGAALDLTARAGSYYFDDSDDGPYLDWTSRNRVTRVRHLDVGNDGDTTTLLLSGAELRQLRDGIGRLIGAVNDGQPVPGAMYPGDEDQGAYIDWSVSENGMRYVEFSDGDTAVVLDLTAEQVREWHERLALQVQLDDQDGLA